MLLVLFREREELWWGGWKEVVDCLHRPQCCSFHWAAQRLCKQIKISAVQLRIYRHEKTSNETLLGNGDTETRTCRHTDRQTDSHIYMHTHKSTNTVRHRQTHTHTYTQKHRLTDSHNYTETDTQKDTDKHRQPGIHTHTYTHTNTDRLTYTHTHKHR